MKSKYLNHSSEKTRALIKNTFSKLLMEEKELNKITVSKLVEIADINRSTFYNHYDNIFAIAKDLEDEVLAVLIDSSKEFNSIDDIFNFFDDVISYLKDNENMYKQILTSKEPLIFLEKLNNMLQENLFLYFKKTNNKNATKINISFYADGVLNQALRYFKGDTTYSLDTLNVYMRKWFNMLFENN